MHRFLYPFILSLLLFSFLLYPAALWADDLSPIRQFLWLGRIVDKVGTAAPNAPDGQKDLTFQVVLDFQAETLIDEINIYLCNDLGEKQGEFWHSNGLPGIWILGVSRQGAFLNDTPGQPLGLFDGPVLFDLYAKDSGRIPEKSFFLVEVKAAEKLFTAIIQAGTPAMPLTTTPPSPKVGKDLFNNTNTEVVANLPIYPTFTIAEDYYLTYVMTRHFVNHGTPPGTIAVRHEDGTLYGPWQASGGEEKDGVANALWEVTPNIVIKAGNYTIIDSDPATWSVNAASQHRGHARLQGYPAREGMPEGIVHPAEPPRNSGTLILGGVLPLPPMTESRKVGDIAIAGPTAMKSVLDSVTVRNVAADDLTGEARAAYQAALANEQCVLASTGYHFSSAAPQGWLGGSLVIEVPIPEEFRDQVTPENAGLVWMSPAGPVFYPGVLVPERHVIRVTINHFSDWFFGLLGNSR